MDEAGLPGFYISMWNGLWVPKGVAPNLIARLKHAAVGVMANPALQKRCVELDGIWATWARGPPFSRRPRTQVA